MMVLPIAPILKWPFNISQVYFATLWIIINKFCILLFILSSHSQILPTSGISQGATDKYISPEVTGPKLLV